MVFPCLHNPLHIEPRQHFPFQLPARKSTTSDAPSNASIRQAPHIGRQFVGLEMVVDVVQSAITSMHREGQGIHAYVLDGLPVPLLLLDVHGLLVLQTSELKPCLHIAFQLVQDIFELREGTFVAINQPVGCNLTVTWRSLRIFCEATSISLRFHFVYRYGDISISQYITSSMRWFIAILIHRYLGISVYRYGDVSTDVYINISMYKCIAIFMKPFQVCSRTQS